MIEKSPLKAAKKTCRVQDEDTGADNQQENNNMNNTQNSEEKDDDHQKGKKRKGKRNKHLVINCYVYLPNIINTFS